MNDEVSPEEKARLQRIKEFRPGSIFMGASDEQLGRIDVSKSMMAYIEENQKESARMSTAKISVYEDYIPLFNILYDAYLQSAEGKGKKCHANGKPFMEQPIIIGGRECGPGGLAFQARKKILEALNCEDDERAIEDYLGAIVYTAALVLLRREK